MIQIKNKLTKFVKLNEIKVIPSRNKKIISTCLYIPGNLSYNERSIYYFQGLVKSVETFDSVMNLDTNNRWIYRIYYDKMFDNGINFKRYKKKKTKKMTSKKKREEMKRRKLILSKKKKELTNEYNYAYNRDNYKGGPLDVQETLSKYKDSFKKLLKLYHLYLKQIKNNKANRYKNIELISYDCPEIKINPEFIGHSSSFGMFLRFTPILDSDVDLFYSVNSTHPITPQLRLMLDKWVSNTDEHAFCFAYQTGNVIESSKKYIVEPVEAIKTKHKSNDLMPEQENEFIEIIDQIFGLLPDTTEPTYDFNSIKKKGSRASKSYRASKSSKLLDSDYNFKHLLYNKGRVSLDMAIGGGMFGFKKDFPTIIKRYDVFIDYINYLIRHKIQLEYGLDELILKIILLPDVYIYYDDIYSVDYINIRELNQYAECSSSIFQLKQHPSTNSYVSDEHGTNIYFNRDALFNPHFNIFGDNWLIQIDAVDSRALYKKEDGSVLSSDEILTLKIDEYDLSFNSLFVSFNEPTKLLVLDNSTKSHSLFKPSNIFEIEHIHTYDTNNIYKLLLILIKYYRENIVQPIINF
jgi:hypothetical protein